LFEDALAGLDAAQQSELQSMLGVICTNLTRKPLETAHG
jgi:hypothetical protein